MARLVQGGLRRRAYAAHGKRLHELRAHDEVREGHERNLGLPAGVRAGRQLPADAQRARGDEAGGRRQRARRQADEGRLRLALRELRHRQGDDQARLRQDPRRRRRALKAASSLKVEVGGHTDNVGAADANQKLSQDRAQAVMAALASRGIPASRMTAKGYGQTVPIADNRTEEGRAKNRRVELVRK
ncbi:MAG: OmpA family protein [Holophagales bacterium]|nr:OmpA family protein [Holophagales bacterium]